ncbi:MAG: hypothetical protein KQI81_08945 [Deltaproteobacteria bacterium]|nr:hypothetical protein [Deltaproteobacteria bacterium]
MRIETPLARIAFPSDEHIPYQNDYARAVALQIVADFNPSILISGSDAMDLYSLSKFDKNPERIKGGVYEEIKIWNRCQNEWFDSAPSADRYYILGNHEYRYLRFLWNLPQLYYVPKFALAEILELDKKGIIWNDNDRLNTELQVNDAVVIKHGKYVRKESAYSARAEVDGERYSISTITGHTHRGGSYFSRSRSGIIQGHEAFCLCDLEPEYIEHPNWQNGITLAEVKNNDLTVENILIHGEGKNTIARWRGKEYRA